MDQRGRVLGRMETIRNREQHYAKDCEMVGGSKTVHSIDKYKGKEEAIRIIGNKDHKKSMF